MKILYVYRYSILGGVSTQLANRLMYLKDKCEPHFVFLRDYGGRSVFGEYPYTYIIQSVNELAKFIKGNNFDLVITVDTEEAYEAIEKANYQGKVINEVHTTTTNIRYLNTIKDRKIDAFLAPSRYLANRIENEFNYKEKVPVIVTYNCLDTELFKKKDTQFEKENKIILWVGKLDEHKNWPSFLSIAYSLMRDRDDCEFWMIGGETANDEVVENLINYAGEYNLLTRFRWIQRVEYEHMPEIYSLVAQSGGLSVSTSQNESFGMTVVESLACGCPTLAPMVGAIPEILDDRLSDCLYPLLDEDTAVEKIKMLFDDQDYRQLIMNEGPKRVRERYGIEQVGKSYYNILKNIVKVGY